MPRVTGNVTDIAGRPASGRLQVRASAVRQNAAGSAVVDERTFEYPIVAGVITGTEVVDPGPATVSLSSGGRFKSWNVVVPEGATVDLWTLVEQYVEYTPPVLAAAQQAAADAEAAAIRAQDAAAEATGGIAYDTDGVPYFTSGASAISTDTDGVPYLTGV